MRFVLPHLTKRAAGTGVSANHLHGFEQFNSWFAHF
jgi:hypothetical protein